MDCRSPRTSIRGLRSLCSIQVPGYFGRRSVRLPLLSRRVCNLIQIKRRGKAFRIPNSLKVNLSSFCSGTATIDHPKRVSVTLMITISSYHELFNLLKAIHPRQLRRFHRSSRPRSFDCPPQTVDTGPHFEAKATRNFGPSTVQTLTFIVRVCPYYGFHPGSVAQTRTSFIWNAS